MVYWKRNFLNATEAFRLATEFNQFRATWPELRATAPQGDGHPVLIIPGFTASDLPSYRLRRALREVGYNAYGWDGGVNTGLRNKTVEHLHSRLKEIYDENGGQKVSLIGHSMGGIYARCLAHEFPDMVRDVITVGSPFGIGMNKGATPALLVNTIQLLSNSKYSLKVAGMAERLLTPPDVPTTSIFSKMDGIAGWRACLNPKTRWSENIEVKSSHMGMICNKDVLSILLDRLAQPEGAWKIYKNASKETPPPNPAWKPAANSNWRLFPKP